jgi:hypothetical protein
MKTFRKFLDEDGIANCVGGGQIAGVGVGPNGEPGVDKKKKKKVVLATLRRKVPDATPKN